MKDLLIDMLEDLALFGSACLLALQSWIGLVLFGLYTVALFIRGNILMAVIMTPALGVLVWRKLHVRTTVVLEEEDDD